MNKKMRTHKDLDIWKLAMELVTDIYKKTRTFPKEEIYGLTSQLRRSAISIPSNMAEGAARGSKKEYLHFLYISLGSLSEFETQIIIAENLGYLKSEELMAQVEILRRKMLNFIKYLKGIKS